MTEAGSHESGTRKFVIVSAPRCGSTMLATMLNGHPDVICGGEVLNDVWIDTGGRIDWARKSRHAQAIEGDPAIHALRRADPIGFLGRLHELAVEEGYAVIGFKMLYAHGALRPRVVEYLASLDELRVIHLRRSDRLRRLVSLKRAVETGEWAVVRRDSDRSSPTRIRIEWDELTEDFETRLREEQAVARVFADRPVCDVEYGQLQASPDRVAQQVQGFLGVESRPLRPRTRRQGGDHPRDAITNYDELRIRARGTAWEELFDD